MPARRMLKRSPYGEHHRSKTVQVRMNDQLAKSLGLYAILLKGGIADVIETILIKDKRFAHFHEQRMKGVYDQSSNPVNQASPGE